MNLITLLISIENFILLLFLNVKDTVKHCTLQTRSLFEEIYCSTFITCNGGVNNINSTPLSQSCVVRNTSLGLHYCPCNAHY